MGSLRNPIGPLPSSIYWRRRAVAASLIALLALLIAWALSSGGGKGGKADDGANGSTPAPSITPGPAQSGPAISEQPGGRDESGDTGGDTGGESDGTDAGSGGDPGKNGDNGTGGASSGGGGGQQVPAGSSLPDCAPGAVKFTLRSLKVSYEPGVKPTFQLVAANSSATTCKADFGPKAVVLTVTDDKDDDVWSSKDCPHTPGSLLLRVPAGASITHTVEWDRRRSAPQCATPPAGAVPPGTYLLEAEIKGVTVLPASFRLDKD
ncbi:MULTISPECIES: hypothetical protein [unclassified Streptomyces]|uniref:hypothetical protein n=1 Tax=unclassified Streptomyces TaxID=2593676 RepID=UPI002DDA5B7C|nr:hypothetical protein [Streptomyces sp. NBC_01750]WSB01114.1 hypothetical protein OIE54_18415 [Streptomyces sp. NBC_01794]WSD34533.1 hypothetical protein OG966_23195 [Streptomyces sp. NBC_01750]